MENNNLAADVPSITPEIVMVNGLIPKAYFLKRIGAYIIDAIALIGIGIVGLLISRLFERQTFDILSLIVCISLPVYYLTKDALFSGQSLGKKASRQMVIHISSGKPCSLWRSVLRNIILWVPGIVFIEFFMAFATKSGRRIGDYLAGTQVIDTMFYIR
ncbi:RDD family protein [Acetonema longum]|uniref:RDD domain-containing protein n=1 Tax=Acetonema longum DSM 6540 TaxID=1009370 RepID=F7NQB4_9FIRM|nr:RDD family protein [Acetonema longum]EGO61755.1 hypothetical protein ALO_21586 [Acetonema longum DSM 6540]